MGDAGGCAVTGNVESCQDPAKANAHNIEQLTIATEAVTEYVTQIKKKTTTNFWSATS